ncbi:YafY family protein [Nesterenkonia sp.]|uniref:helix-turn-helix transcriptional regulator n=1 Tax=Nesterenkonia sp. TaxID=704201 RepID=UPI002626AA7F|nr:YafY family protein [Nesterenkonia sp.]
MAAEATTERVLRLLGLLQRRPLWTGAQLAEQLGVTERSVRRDVERLRALGYPVEASAGVGGGYRLRAGSELPPLLFDDDEATATAVSLRIAAGGTVSGVGEAALRALAKLDQVMPPRLRGQARSLHEATDTLWADEAAIDSETLVLLARACRDCSQVRFRYTGSSGGARVRRAEPVRMVATGWRWYLMAYDLDKQDWRTFRLDSITELEVTTWRFTPRAHPDPVDYVQRSVTASPYRHQARVRLHAPAAEVRDRIPPQVARIEDDDVEGWCVLHTGADDLNWLAVHIALLDVPAEILEPAALRGASQRLAERLHQMSRS